LLRAASLVIKGYQLLHEGKYPASLKCFVRGIKRLPKTRIIREDSLARRNNRAITWEEQVVDIVYYASHVWDPHGTNSKLRAADLSF
jgi:hypothetical protein